MQRISVDPDTVFLRRASLSRLLTQRFRFMEWVWATDTHELIFGNGISVGGVRGFYAGGQIMTQIINVRYPRPQLVHPPFVPRAWRIGQILKHGQAVYDRDEQWIYVGDGLTAGGCRTH